MRTIDDIRAYCVKLPLREPFETAQRKAVDSSTVFVQLIAGDMVGWGEATPVRYVTGEDTSTVIMDVAAGAEVLRGSRLSEYRLSSRKLADTLPHGKSARAGIEMAILDALCKSLNIPLFSYFGGAAVRIETDVTIPICPPEHARNKALSLADKGFRMFKVKVGKEKDEDIARVMAIHEAVSNCSFVIDANQGFTPTYAVNFTRELKKLGIHIRMLEQPVDAFDIDGLKYVTDHIDVPVFADEAAQTPEDVLEIVRNKAANGVNVKIMKAGMVGALEIKSICRAAGIDLMFGCMLESKIGQSAAAHLACGTAAFSVFDLDSDLLLADNQPVQGGAERIGPILKLSDRPGLGCEVIESALESFGKCY